MFDRFSIDFQPRYTSNYYPISSQLSSNYPPFIIQSSSKYSPMFLQCSSNFRKFLQKFSPVSYPSTSGHPPPSKIYRKSMDTQFSRNFYVIAKFWTFFKEVATESPYWGRTWASYVHPPPLENLLKIYGYLLQFSSNYHPFIIQSSSKYPPMFLQ